MQKILIAELIFRKNDRSPIVKVAVKIKHDLNQQQEVNIWGFTGDPHGSLIDTIQEDGEKRITCKHTAVF